MTHEELVGAVAWMLYEYKHKQNPISYARAVIALIAEQTKEATPAMRNADWWSKVNAPLAVDIWSAMQAKSALYPESTP